MHKLDAPNITQKPRPQNNRNRSNARGQMILETHTWLAVMRKPGLCEVSVLKVLAVSLPTLSWKCCMPLGNKITSPTCSVAAYSTLSSLMKPVYTVPLSTKSVSAARGWVCSGNTPPTAKSRRAWVMPCVLMPGHSSGTTTIAPDPVGDCAISAGDATATAAVVAQLL